jgi:signal transduction histidine kinase
MDGNRVQNPKSNLASEIAALRLENAALKQQLIATQRTATLGELVGTTTHEFNNVLMTIMNYAKLGLRNKDDASREKSLTKILAASERAAKITHSVLGMARNRKDQFELTQIADLVHESMVLLEREMQRYRVQVELELDPVPDVPVNGNQIQQVLLNLLINARQAMPDGGSLIVRVKHDLQTNTVDLIVRDHGKGIPKDKLPRIFDPYFTTKSGPDATGKGGTGLGLATCKDIIQSHEGKIRVESQVGKGTCFTIKLPIKRAVSGIVLLENKVIPSETLHSTG